MSFKLLAILTLLGFGIVGSIYVLFLTNNQADDQYSNNPEILFTQNKPNLTPDIPNLTLDYIFSDSHVLPSQLPDSEVVTIIATGDVMTARNVNKKSVTKNNFLWSFENTAELLKSGDITFINLENPLFDKCPLETEQFTFCGEDDHLQGLLFSGIDVVSLANNHTLNFGREKLNQTSEILKSGKIVPTGLGETAIIEKKGSKYAFLGFNEVGVEFDEKKYQNEIASAKTNADIVIVGIHFGIEYVSQPTEKQIKLAHLGIDSGADLIVGNHPHWIQPVEIYKGKVITYAHGNFIFDQMWSQKTREGVAGIYKFYKNRIVDVEFVPVIIEDYGQPRIAQGGEKQRILSEMKSESVILSQSQKVN